jgi:hypothetical protein
MLSRNRAAHLLALGRLACLPTIWSNCLAGWWLSGAGSRGALLFLLGGAAFLHMGGSLLNDTFDAEYDREHHPNRPIPSGAFSRETVWRWALGFLAAGALVLLWIGQVTGALGLVLVSTLVIRNALHRVLALSPALDGLSRLFFYVIGASVGLRGVTGWSIWCGMAMAAYAAGVGCLARREGTPASRRYWPVTLLAAPILLALLMDAGPYRETGLLLSMVVSLWLLRALRPILWPVAPEEPEVRSPGFSRKEPSAQKSSTLTENSPAGDIPLPQSASPNRNGTSIISRTLSGLLAGIVFVDWLAVCPVTLTGQDNQPARELSLVFLALFGLTWVLQRVASAPIWQTA